jgi:hypothetical protein
MMCEVLFTALIGVANWKGTKLNNGYVVDVDELSCCWWCMVDISGADSGGGGKTNKLCWDNITVGDNNY